MCSKNKTQNGFTLVELLVVIAIVTVIAAILFPVFAEVRERGRRTVCQSNLHQLELGMEQYVQDNNGVYPIEGGSFVENGKLNYVPWQYVIYPYIASERVFHCPSSENDVFDSIGLHIQELNLRLVYTSYGFDSDRLNLFSPPTPKGIQERDIYRPSMVWLNRDDGWINSNGECRDCDEVKTSYGEVFNGSGIHSGGGNYSYVDGHVKWLTPEEAGEIECANGPLPAPFKD
jgi:prepilin-type N-terminal cleavage/methylation domain-containing protein/prepilin-type processing-associated H-X9-DG protein